MEIAILIFRILFSVVAGLVALLYILFQFYQKVPAEKFSLATVDYVLYGSVAILFGFGTNSYYGLISFLPLLLCKLICWKFILTEKINSGFWMEVDWKKLNPKGFERNVPKHILEEMNKVVNSAPKDTHFLIPRFYVTVAIYFILKRMKKEANKLPSGISTEQQNMGIEQITVLTNNILKLEKGKTEKKDLNIGVLRVTRR